MSKEWSVDYYFGVCTSISRVSTWQHLRVVLPPHFLAWRFCSAQVLKYFPQYWQTKIVGMTPMLVWVNAFSIDRTREIGKVWRDGGWWNDWGGGCRVGLGGFHCGDLSWKSTGGQVSYKNNGPSPWGLRLNSSMRASRARTWGPITSALFFKIDESKWNKWLNDIKTDCWTTSESQTKCKFYYITCYSWLAEILKNRSVRSVLGLMRFKYHGLVRVESISPSCGGGVGILDRLLAFHNSNSLLQHNPAYVTFYLHQWWELNPWRKEGRRGVERRSS